MDIRLSMPLEMYNGMVCLIASYKQVLLEDIDKVTQSNLSQESKDHLLSYYREEIEKIQKVIV